MTKGLWPAYSPFFAGPRYGHYQGRRSSTTGSAPVQWKFCCWKVLLGRVPCRSLYSMSLLQWRQPRRCLVMGLGSGHVAIPINGPSPGWCHSVYPNLPIDRQTASTDDGCEIRKITDSLPLARTQGVGVTHKGNCEIPTHYSLLATISGWVPPPSPGREVAELVYGDKGQFVLEFAPTM